MKHDVQHETEIRRYLLGELPREEQVLIEQRLFMDSEYAELHQAVGDDLIDEYLAEELVGGERERFVNHFLLLPEHSADLRITQALQKYLAADVRSSSETDQNKTSNNAFTAFFLNKPIVWLSVTVAALILLSIISWLAFRSTRGPAADEQQQTRNQQSTQPRSDERPEPAPTPSNDDRVETAEKGNTNGSGVKPERPGKPRERGSPSAQAMLSYVLQAGVPTRSGGSRKTVTIYAQTREVVLQLPLEFSQSYERYTAELLRGEHRIDQWPNLRSQSDERYGSIVSVQVPADLFREQSYRIKLHGIPSDQQYAEPPTTYPFNVERK